MSLNSGQRSAASAPHSQPLKIIAGAGTGKTETLAARYIELVRRGIAPERIVLLTFTEDAAAEMRARVMLRLREAAIGLPPHALLDVWISTFHGFAMRLLREYGMLVGLPPTPRLLSDEERVEALHAARETVEGPSGLPGYDPLAHTIYRWDTDETWNRVEGVVEKLRRGGGSLRDLLPHPQLADQQTTTYAAHRAQLVPLIEHCYRCYTDHLRARGALDFDQQLRSALRLLRQRPSIGDRFDVVMIDEFQDTNRPQLDLLTGLHPDWSRTTVVGDPRQAIYGWNAARAEIIKQFPFDEGLGITQPLTVNYRSHPAMIYVANLALAGSELGEEPPLEAPDDRSPSEPPLIDRAAVSLHVLPDVEAETAFIAAQIGRLHAQGVPYGNMAVLLRARTRLKELRQALHDAGIPYVVNGGTGLYLHPLVRLTSSLLRLIVDPTDAAALTHVLESQLAGLSCATLAYCPDRSARESLPFTRWLLEPASLPDALPDHELIAARLSDLRALLDAARARAQLLPPGAFLDWLWRSSGLAQPAEPIDRQVLRRLLRDADEWSAAYPDAGIDGFAALLQQRVAEQPRVPLPTQPAIDAVEVATVHQAKGREWPVVFVFHTDLPGVRAGQIERVLWDEQWNLVISEGDSSRAGSSDPLQALRADLRRRKRNEERSVWYVALTRARDRLYVLHSGCAYDAGFADARARIDPATASGGGSDAVHFFHELWERLAATPESLRAAIARQSHLPVQP